MTLLSAGSLWLVQQAGALTDTIVTKQGPISPGWFERTTGILQALLTLSLLVLTVAVVPAAWNFRKSYAKISDLLDRVYADVNPITHHASRIADNVDFITTAIRADVMKVNATVDLANEKLLEAIWVAEKQIREAQALVEVMQEEVESAFVASASVVRGVRVGTSRLQDEALPSRQARRSVRVRRPSPVSDPTLATDATEAADALDEDQELDQEAAALEALDALDTFYAEEELGLDDDDVHEAPTGRSTGSNAVEVDDGEDDFPIDEGAERPRVRYRRGGRRDG
jgi:uncharacterized protein YoxC